VRAPFRRARKPTPSVPPLPSPPSLKMTIGIHSEVESQHALLDGMSDGMATARAGLAAAALRFRRVFDTPRGRSRATAAAGAAGLLFLLMLLLKR